MRAVIWETLQAMPPASRRSLGGSGARWSVHRRRTSPRGRSQHVGSGDRARGQSQGTEQRHSAADERIGAGPGRSVRREANSASLSAQAYQRKPISASLSARGATADGGSPIDVIRPSAWQHRAGASFRSVAIKPHRAGSPRSACTQGTRSASSREPPVAPGGERRALRPATSLSERPERGDAERVPLAVKSSRGSRKQRFQTGPRPGRSGRAAIARGRHGSLPYEGS